MSNERMDEQMKNKEEGITLIALIITIIVMLILVAVTINVALNGGLFDKAKDASDKTQRQAEKEELIAAMVGAYDNTGKFNKDLIGPLPSGAKWCNEDTKTYSEAGNLNVTPTGNGDWIITKENNKFYITSDGTVLDEKPQGVDDLIPTVKELDDGYEYGNGIAFAEGESCVLLYVEQNSLNCMIDGSLYVWITSEQIATSAGAEAFKWYKDSTEGLEQSAPPINASKFSTVYSESYLSRVLASL